MSTTNSTNTTTRPAVAGQLEAPVRPRAAFEAWISSPPYEREIERFGDGSAWPGNYRELDVDLAWCAWSAAMATTRERYAQKLAQAEYLIGAFERGADASDYARDIAEFRA